MKEFTIIDDSVFIYPVKTKDYLSWIEKNGKITARNYEKFCFDVDFVTPKATKNKGTVIGSAEMINYCKKLLDFGAEMIKLS